MSTLDEEAKEKLERFWSKIDQRKVSRLRFPAFYPSASDGPGAIYMIPPCALCYLNEAVAVNHYILDRLASVAQMPPMPNVIASVDRMDAKVATRLSSYLSNPAAGIEEIVVERSPTGCGRQSDAVVAVTNTLIREGILMATTLQKITFSRVTIAEKDLLALLHSNNFILRELRLKHVVILPAKKKCWFPPNLSGTTLKVKELTFEMSEDETEEGLACIARLVHRISSSGSLDKATFMRFDGRLPSHVYGSLTQVHTVVLKSCFITKHQLLQLALGLEENHGTKSLAFPKCRFSRQAGLLLGKVMGKVQGLESVEIGELKSHAAQSSFLRGVRQNGSLRSLSIAEASIRWNGNTSRGLQFFALNCSLVSLRLSDFGSLSVGNTLSVLCKNLQRNQTLRSLHLSYIGNFEPLSKYIRQNSSLQELIVEECDLTRTDSKLLLDAVAVNTTLRKLCVKDCDFFSRFEERNVPWERILPKMKWLSQFHLHAGCMSDVMLRNLVSGLEGNYSLLQFSTEWGFYGGERLQADKHLTRNLRSHATLALAGSSRAQLLPRVVSALSSLSTDQFLVFEVLRQHCDTFYEGRTECNTPTL